MRRSAKQKSELDIVKEVNEDSNLGFGDAQTAIDAAASHKKVHETATPAQKAMMAAASEAMMEVENIFDGPILDENVQFVQNLLKTSGVIIGDFEDSKAEKIANKIKGLKLNEYIIIEGKVFFMTGDQKIQEAAAYVNRLEKTTIKFMKDRTEALEQEKLARENLKQTRFFLSDYENLLSVGFFGRLKFAFRGFLK